jgi:ribonuclease P protein component
LKRLPLPKTSLLTKSYQYNEVYKHGTRIKGNGFSLIFRANNLQEDRLGISISGVRLAVQRNRLKRIIKEFYRNNRLYPSQVARRQKSPNRTDLVIATRRHFLPDSLTALNQALTMCLQGSPRSSNEVRENPVKNPAYE